MILYAIPLLGTYSKKMKTLIWKGTCTPSGTVQNSITYKHAHTHTEEYYSATEKEWNSAICNAVGGPKEYYA